MTLRATIELDVTGLSDAEVEDIRRHVQSKQPGPETYEYDWKGWRCFHCGNIFMTPFLARLHFGKRVTEPPLCAAEQKHLAEARKERDELSAIRADLLSKLLAQDPTHDRQ